MTTLTNHMTSLKDYICESIGIDVATCKKMTEDYVALLGADKIKEAVNQACAKVNNIISILDQNNVLFVTRGQFVGRVFESCFGSGSEKHLLSVNGFTFKQGVENSREKDFECTSISGVDNKEFAEKYKDIISVGDPHSYGIELKCFMGTSPVGNKSYAVDAEGGKKDKSAFYLLISYNKQTDRDGNTKSVSVKNVQMAYLTQADWKGSAKGNAASLTAEAKGKIVTL